MFTHQCYNTTTTTNNNNIEEPKNNKTHTCLLLPPISHTWHGCLTKHANLQSLGGRYENEKQQQQTNNNKNKKQNKKKQVAHEVCNSKALSSGGGRGCGWSLWKGFNNTS